MVKIGNIEIYTRYCMHIVFCGLVKSILHNIHKYFHVEYFLIEHIFTIFSIIHIYSIFRNTVLNSILQI